MDTGMGTLEDLGTEILPVSASTQGTQQHRQIQSIDDSDPRIAVVRGQGVGGAGAANVAKNQKRALGIGTGNALRQPLAEGRKIVSFGSQGLELIGKRTVNMRTDLQKGCPQAAMGE